MTTTAHPIERVREEVLALKQVLIENGWRVVNGPGDMASPDGIIWFSMGYATGEYTVSCWGRKHGSGPAIGTTRIRLTEAVISANPGLGRVLGFALAFCAEDNASQFEHEFPGEGAWPPAEWAVLAV